MAAVQVIVTEAKEGGNASTDAGEPVRNRRNNALYPVVDFWPNALHAVQQTRKYFRAKALNYTNHLGEIGNNTFKEAGNVSIEQIQEAADQGLDCVDMAAPSALQAWPAPSAL